LEREQVKRAQDAQAPNVPNVPNKPKEPNGRVEECEVIKVGLNRTGVILKQELYRIGMMLRRWFDPRLQQTDADFHQFTARLYSGWGLAYALFCVWFAWVRWVTVWRIPALGVSLQGVINAVLLGALFRFGGNDLSRHIEWWRFVASANLLLGLFTFAWLGSLDTGWSLGAFHLIAFQVVNYIITLTALRFLRQFALRLPETSTE
jgi:hypothetical protein